MSALALTLACNEEEWNRLREHISAYGDSQGLTAEVVRILTLVSEEWLLNVIRHGYENRMPESEKSAILFVMKRLPSNEIMLHFMDCAPAFNPLLQPLPDVTLPVEERQIGGLGIYLIRKMMDRCLYRRTGSRNHFCLYKKL